MREGSWREGQQLLWFSFLLLMDDPKLGGIMLKIF
jgi:hypothetical protein